MSAHSKYDTHCCRFLYRFLCMFGHHQPIKYKWSFASIERVTFMCECCGARISKQYRVIDSESENWK